MSNAQKKLFKEGDALTITDVFDEVICVGDVVCIGTGFDSDLLPIIVRGETEFSLLLWQVMYKKWDWRSSQWINTPKKLIKYWVSRNRPFIILNHKLLEEGLAVRADFIELTN
tara:strand:+ start:699 stop:1037 length:339 start_codon:yes stop_codon:yes gene_type:complete